MRLKGVGNIKGILYSYDDVNSNDLGSKSMALAIANPVDMLADFTSFVSKLKLYTTEFDEEMNISEIIIYSRPVANSFPN